ncbi:acyltransferase family protein [Pseudomonas abietaniphila]|uniref:Peptidoglycan/LPS O-acetylase OafA/YrhL, contains acyltransferase and SGNH-hydrolase domains n=1 Tax=Pseudomonas abietaniphila TaxID=89065 RepID=A0A1G8R4B8_9PSED|nr:acyltransferase [Pseudomonas abietaniphila]SDJ11435.1 Peptidoglycan/LPS O-acetylase OafA/YrhL, contains acyltransferase and SGNH-hydrolase domains [Pseudomonas abietaniphila]
MLETFQLLALYVLSVATFCLIAGRFPLLAPEAQHRVSSLDGLRGILATAVMVHHFAITFVWHNTGTWQGTESRVINNMGAVPVSLFFMITGYLFTQKMIKGQPRWGSLLSSRLRRIFPMYTASVLLVAGISFYQTREDLSPLVENLQALGSWLIFLGGPINGFADSKLINASVHWTLMYEALFYLSLPVIFCLIRRQLPIVALIVSIGVIACLWPEYHHEFHKRFVKLFLVGMAVAFLEPRLRKSSINFSNIWCSVIAGAVLIASLKLRTYSTGQMLILGIPFGLFVLGNSLHGLLEHKGLKVLGEASFSIYLMHGIVIYTAFSLLHLYDFSAGTFAGYAWYLPLIIMAVSALSVLTYWTIERPFIISAKLRPLKPAEQI